MINSLINRLYEACELTDNWDGYDGKATSKEAVRNAIIFLNKILYIKNIDKVDFVPEPDGCISLNWENKKRCFSISFTNAELVYYSGIFEKSEIKGVARFDSTGYFIAPVLVESIAKVYIGVKPFALAMGI